LHTQVDDRRSARRDGVSFVEQQHRLLFLCRTEMADTFFGVSPVHSDSSSVYRTSKQPSSECQSGDPFVTRAGTVERTDANRDVK
jgi:hypothetical protein